MPDSSPEHPDDGPDDAGHAPLGDTPGGPAVVAALPTPEQAAEARAYSRASLRWTLIDMGLDLVVLIAMVVLIGPAIDGWLSGFTPLAGERSLARLVALGALITGIHSVISLPVSFFGGHRLEHRFGLSTQSLRAWAGSWAKKSLLAVLLLSGLYAGLFVIIWNAGAYWWVAAAAAFFLVGAVLGQLAPVVILPLFYEVTPLEGDEDAERLRALAAGTGVQIEGVFRLGMSAETTKANAMLAGLGSTRRVLLGDTLLDSFTPAEIDMVFAHELGHHVHRHLAKLLALAGVTALLGFYLCHAALSVWTGVGDPGGWPVAALPKVALLLTVFSMLIGPLQNMVSRAFERQADAYALRRTGDAGAFRSAFLKLARMNKADLDPHPLEVWLLHSHPPIRERLASAGVTA
ncbi:MAG: M48 family metallopeptidase [Planctomycetota bacterium]